LTFAAIKDDRSAVAATRFVCSTHPGRNLRQPSPGDIVSECVCL
jgi:hypothetical protein